MNERDITRERFVNAIADKVNPESIAEAHLFHPIKQGGLESGVAVLAVREGQQAAGAEDVTKIPMELADTGAEGDAENTPALASTFATAAEDAQIARDERLAVYTAKYLLTLKGPDRGKWAFDMHAEADAPLVTVDRVVQGVQRRSGDAEDPQKLSGDEFRALLPPRDSAQDQVI